MWMLPWLKSENLGKQKNLTHQFLFAIMTYGQFLTKNSPNLTFVA